MTSESIEPDRSVVYQVVNSSEPLKHVVSVLVCDDRQR